MKQRNRVDQIRESLRLQQVYNVFMRYGMDMLFDRGLLGDFRRTMQEKIYDPPQPLEWALRLLQSALERKSL